MVDYRVILSQYGLSRTKFRADLLHLFYSLNKSLLIEDILIYFENSIDKVTVYRSLESFEKKGLIHKVPDRNNLKRYALCRNEECITTLHNHNHGHFMCFSCQQTFCLDKIKSPDITSLKGFHVKNLKLIVEGYCQDCYIP
tara:strand:+ start:42 stop:464 length:423 start_codon:yes stop_codon:yes gene_type:complete